MEAPVNIQEFLEYVVEQLTGAVGDGVVTSREEGGREIFEVVVPERQVSRLIGHEGSTIKAVRTLVAAAAWREGRRVGVEVKD
jgi:predicted RNA-binding protein YlqC (UPF0109 family)